jgi:hypothetical protein
LLCLERRDDSDTKIWVTIIIAQPFDVYPGSGDVMPSRQGIGHHVFYCGMVGSMGVGFAAESFELPGRTEKYCRACSADVATAILLTTEIDVATLAGRSTNALVSEFSEISSRMLERSQSAELGNG